MGITGLAKLISDISPDAIHNENNLKNYSGKKVAMDASMLLYQCLTSPGALVTSPDGESAHLVGTFYSNIRLLQNGVMPVYIFDGKPPKLKSKRLKQRSGRRAIAKLQLKTAESKGDLKAIDKYKRRTMKVEDRHVQESKTLLRLMGIPYFEAPGEAEAQCAALVQAGKVYATGTEDMDALTFGTSVLLRHMTYNVSRKIPIQEIHLDKVLMGLNLNLAEFIDLSILLGCDYCGGIKGIGPKRGIKLIQEYRTIEGILDNLDCNKYQVPEDWMYQEARKLFLNPEVVDCDKVEFTWQLPDKDGIVDYLCGEKQFDVFKVNQGLFRLSSMR